MGYNALMFKKWLMMVLSLLVLLLSGACVSRARALPLVLWEDENMPFEIYLPEEWEINLESEDDDTRYLISSSAFSGDENDFRIYLYLARNDAESLEARLVENNARIEPWLAALVDEDYEIYNKNELKVDKSEAMALDFAKPKGESYLVGRVVLVSHPTHTLAFVAMAGEAEWNEYVRSFDKILSRFTIKRTEN